MRYEVPVALVVIIGILMIAEGFVGIDALSTTTSEMQRWGIIISAFALAVGAINLITIHTKNISARKNVPYSLALLAGLLTMSFLGIAFGLQSTAFVFLYDSLVGPMGAAMFAMLAFYVASAAYRAFVARNFDATVLLLTAIVCILYQTGIGELITPRFADLFLWINDVPNLAGQRGIMIASAIGALSVSLRVLVGLERSHFGGME